MVSLEMEVLHYLLSLLGIVKDEEEDAGIAVCLCVCETEVFKWTGPIQWQPRETQAGLTLRSSCSPVCGVCMSLELERNPYLHEGNVALCSRAGSRDVIPLNAVASALRLKLGQGAFTVTARGCWDRNGFETQTGCLVVLALHIPDDGWTPGQVESVIDWAALHILSSWCLIRAVLGQLSGHILGMTLGSVSVTSFSPVLCNNNQINSTQTWTLTASWQGSGSSSSGIKRKNCKLLTSTGSNFFLAQITRFS